MVYYEVQGNIPGILVYLLAINENIDKMLIAVNESTGMLKKHMNRAPWAIEKVQETVLCERGQRKIKVLSEEETKKVLEEESCNFNKIDLVYNLVSPSTKCLH